MRADESLARSTFRFSPAWKKNAITGRSTPQIDRRLAGGRIEDGKFVAHSLSGNERNQLFFNHRGETFENLSAISGLDTPADSRGFVLWDYDHDGLQDIAVVNANEPLLNLYHNEIAGRESSPGGAAGKRGGMIALRFEGGNRSGGPSDFACRDGYGAMVVASLGQTILKREHRCGEGYATQNSATMILGVGALTEVPAITVRWPSGKSAATERVPVGTLLTVYENPVDSPDGTAFVSRPYRRARAPSAVASGAGGRRPRPRFPLADLANLKSSGGVGQPAKFRVYTTMATWCRACITHVPEMRLLESTLRKDGVDFIGVPVDDGDDAEKLRAFVDKWRPPYNLLIDLPADRRRAVTEFLGRLTRTSEPAVPTTVVTDSSGAILLVGSGIPSVSVIRKALSAHPGE